MFERSTSDARPNSDTHRCLAGRQCRNAQNIDDNRLGAITAQPDTLCDTCTQAVQWAINDITETWVALHMSIGEQSRRQTQKVGGSRNPPINLNTDIDALKTAIVEWLTAAAARVAETLNTDDPQPHNNTDTEQARVVIACARILAPNVDRLLELPADNVTVWLAPGETDRPGETWRDDTGQLHGHKIIPMTGADLGLKLADLRRTARKLLGLTTPHDKMTLPCPHCNQLELVRSHRTINLVNGQTKEIDQIDCGACNLSWPYERYRHLCEIWVKEDEMEREKLQQQLDNEKARRELAEWCLAKREWQLTLALDCTDVTASDFAATVLATPTPDLDTYMSDKEIAAICNVSDSTVRSWASRGQITRHTADDGSTVFLAREVWDCAKATERKATA